MSVFGASMSGACTGFLFHNRYRASIVMGRVGSFALGGAIATIAACSGMFIPMFIACSIFLLELLLVIFQVSYCLDYFLFYFFLETITSFCFNYFLYLVVVTLSQHFYNCYKVFASALSCMNRFRCFPVDNG